jgi:hypothetical protein
MHPSLSLGATFLVVLCACGGGGSDDVGALDASTDSSSSQDGSLPDGSQPADGGADTSRPADSGLTDSSTNDAGDASSASDSGTLCPACNSASDFCEVSYGPPQNDGGMNANYSCTPFQSPCDAGTPSCACAQIGPFCTCADDAGNVTVTCPFHP